MIKAIVAYDNNRLIGAGGDLIWKLPADMKFFKEQTMGHICAMARKTWESIPEKYRPLDGRLNIVVSRNADYELPGGVLWAGSMEEVISMYKDPRAMSEYTGKDLFICGGQQLYEAAMPHIEAIVATEIAKSYPIQGLSDLRYFPPIEDTEWYTTNSIPNQTPEGLYFDFVTYERMPQS